MRLAALWTGANVGVNAGNFLWQTKIRLEREKEKSSSTTDRSSNSTPYIDSECCKWLVTPIGIDPNNDPQKNNISPDPKIINEFLFFDPTGKDLTIDCSKPKWDETRFSDLKLTFHQQIFEHYTVKVLQEDNDLLLQFYYKTGDQPLYSTITLKSQATGNRIKEIAVIGDNGSKDLFSTKRLASPLRSAEDWQNSFLKPLHLALQDLSPSKMPVFDDENSKSQDKRKALAEAITDQRTVYLIKTERGEERGHNIVAPKQGMER